MIVLWTTAVLAAVCLALGAAVFLGQAQLRGQREELNAQDSFLSATAAAKAIILSDDTSADTLSDPWATGDDERFSIGADNMEVGAPSPAAESCSWTMALTDESARLNANTATAEMLGKLPGMSAAVAEAFVALRTAAQAAEADDDYRQSLQGLTGPFASQMQVATATCICEAKGPVSPRCKWRQPCA